MSISNVINKNFGNFKGLDLRSSDLQRGEGYSSGMKNAMYNKANVLTKRPGYNQKTTSLGGAGFGIFSNLDLSSGIATQEMMTVGDTLYKVTENSLDVTYTGAGTAYLSILFVDTQYYCIISVDSVEVLNMALGLGREEVSTVSITSLASAINALADFTATGTSATSAAHLQSVENLLLEPSVLTELTYYTSVAVNSSVVAPFATTQTHKEDDSFINASMINGNNVLYIGTGYDDLMKYDGQNLYKAGLPQGTVPTSVANVSVTTISNSSLKYIITYYQKDAKGNIVEGIASSPSTGLNISNTGIDVTVTNLLAASGFNTNCAIINGAQVAVNTIVIDSGHTLNVGDTAYFYDSVSASYQERLISAKTATSITVAGNAVTVADNAVISNNLRIALYRNIAAGSTYSLVAELPNNSFSATQVYSDIIEDANLGAEYIPPLKPHGLPPKGRFLTIMRNQLFIADNLNTVYYSDIDSLEYFPAGDNSFDVYTNRGDTITGLGSLPNLLVAFKGTSIHAASGDFSQDSFRVDQVNKGEIGCIAHHTIQEVNGALYFLSAKGVFSISESAALEELSFRIEPEFTKPATEYNLKKAVAINWLFQDKYMLLLPVEDNRNPELSLDITDSKIFVYEYTRQFWYEWSNINCLGGLVLFENNPWFVERRYSALGGATVYGVYRFNNSGTYLDYIDQDEAVDFSYSTGWEAGDAPSLYKKYLRLKLYSLEGDFKDGEIIPFSVDIDIEHNYIPNTIGSFSMDFSGGGLGWGDDQWDLDSWGASNLFEVVTKLPATKCRSMRMIFTNNTLLENILVSGYEVEIAAPFQPFIKE